MKWQLNILGGVSCEQPDGHETGDPIAATFDHEPSDAEIAAALDGVTQSKAALNAYATQHHDALLNGGFTVSGCTVGTDASGRSYLNGAVLLANADATATFDWEQPDGSSVHLTAAEVTTIAVDVGRFVQACFSALKTIRADIEEGTITTFAGVDGASWPVNHG